MNDRIKQAMMRRTAKHDQDWEACKAWWRAESVNNRMQMISEINSQHADPYIERMSLMALLTLDRLVLEVWPGPGPEIDKDKEAKQ